MSNNRKSTDAPAFAHLRLWLRPLNRVLRDAVARQKAAAQQIAPPDLSALCITDGHAAALLDEVGRVVAAEQRASVPLVLNEEERAREDELRTYAARAGVKLPLDQFLEPLGFSSFDRLALLIVAAPELSTAYERLYAYVLDDINRGYPCVDLILRLTTAAPDLAVDRRGRLARFGRLQREGMLSVLDAGPTELRQQFRLAPGVFAWMTGADDTWLMRRHDPAMVPVADDLVPPGHVEPYGLATLAGALRDGTITAVGVWGPPFADVDEAVKALAAASGKRLRRLQPNDVRGTPREAAAALLDALDAAAGLGAILWAPVELFVAADSPGLETEVAAALASSDAPVILSGSNPWRPMSLLVARSYAEITLRTPGMTARKERWARAAPELDEPALTTVAERYRLSGPERVAAVRIARGRSRLSSNGDSAAFPEQLQAACRMVTGRTTGRFAAVVEPKRTAADLILPADLHAQVMEVAGFFAKSSFVDEVWGLGRMAASDGGIKAFFTGDPGTGKTLAAEVIAGVLGLQLLKVDLAQIVSKWVGETEKNLEAVFREAEESHAVLFFDEADTLFGKRGEIRHGADRYANLEVGFLLQRLEACNGLVILASNLKDEVDTAFTRRFEIVLHFPRPAAEERLRLWQIAFPDEAPLDGEVDPGSLVKLDLTGAGIVGSARTAALLAADEGSETIRMAHIAEAIARQYRREARLLRSSDMAPFRRAAGSS